MTGKQPRKNHGKYYYSVIYIMKPTDSDKETLVNQSCKDTLLIWGAWLIYIAQFCVVMVHQNEWDWVTFGVELGALMSVVLAKLWKKKTREDEEMIQRGSQASFNCPRS